MVCITVVTSQLPVISDMVHIVCSFFQVKPHEESKGEDRGNKMVSEIYLTRLLATKVG